MGTATLTRTLTAEQVRSFVWDYDAAHQVGLLQVPNDATHAEWRAAIADVARAGLQIDLVQNFWHVIGRYRYYRLIPEGVALDRPAPSFEAAN